MKVNALRTTLRLTKALADEPRIRILMLLESGELCVCQIVAVLRLAPSTVSKHLSILAAADLVLLRKQGRWAYYRLPKWSPENPGRPALHWIRTTLKADDHILADREALQAVLKCNPEELCRRQRPRRTSNQDKKEK